MSKFSRRFFTTFATVAIVSATLNSSQAAPISACSPIETNYGSYTVLSFTSIGVCNWTTPATVTQIDFLLIAGGGGGGGGAFGGGGGAGGYTEKSNHTITGSTVYSVSIGAGGAGGAASLTGANDGTNGEDSTFDSFVSVGGGGGAGYISSGGVSAYGAAGGSGGGANEGGGVPSGGASTQNSYAGIGFGNSGGNCISAGSKSGGGGGGAGSAGSSCDETASTYVGGSGGSGKSSNILTGSAITYAAGGDGGSNGISTVRTNEADNTGNGGDGANWPGTPLVGGAGGSGIFIVRYSTTSSFIASFDSQGGSAISNVSTASGGSLADPGTPTKAGYTFKGWFTAATGGSPIAFPYAHSQNADFTLFAQWNVVVVDSPSAAASNPVRTTETSNKSLAKTGASTFDYQLIFFGMFSLILGIQLIRRKPSSR